MNIETIRMLFDYNYWAHRKVWGCVMQLTDDQFTRESDYSIGSVHAQVVHVMSAEWNWLSRVQGTSPKSMLNPADFPTRPQIRAHWDGIEAEMRAYLAALTDADLDREIAYARMSGGQYGNRLRGILLHLANHGTDHRAQILSLIGGMGGQTVEQDLIFYLREKGI